MFSLEDMREWQQDRLNFPPMSGSFVIGGSTLGKGSMPSFPAVLDGNPQENIRLTVSSASSCSVFDYQTYRRGKLHSEFPHMLNFEPFRPGKDTVIIRSIYGGEPMQVHGRARIPIEIDEEGYEVEAYLVDLHSSTQGVLSFQFLEEYGLQLRGTPDGMQMIVPQSRT
ncbi:hypothetical protein BGZ65_012221 [Modicella reniformis]|uniref:Uncharacterized protein n=1 Tax=Modicella reniformis TaxID=1440133 RepID=A0A9P6LTF5_9FUNG|nr:hypothetical protein BGZ65_012221 [Modicella reniformis]